MPGLPAAVPYMRRNRRGLPKLLWSQANTEVHPPKGPTVSRRKGAPWASTSLPDIRRHWCNAIDSVADYGFDEIDPDLPPGAPAHVVAMGKRIERMKAKLADTAEVMKEEAQALRSAQLYWVSRDMVDVVLSAARSLPEWSPALAAPAPTGLLCWGKSAGTVPYGKPLPDDVTANLNAPGYIPGELGRTQTTDIAWDGLWWWTRPDGLMQMNPCSRDVALAGMLQTVKTTSPLWAAHTIMLNPQVPRTDETHSSEHAYPFVSAVGAAWLLMAQANVTETHTISSQAPQPRDTGPGETPSAPSDPSAVTIVELRRRPVATRDAAGDSGRTLDHRIPVTGYWRQQPCGPGNSQRMPKFIADHERGPEGAPLIVKDRVHVLRRRR